MDARKIAEKEVPHVKVCTCHREIVEGVRAGARAALEPCEHIPQSDSVTGEPVHVVCVQCQRARLAALGGEDELG